MIKRGGLPVLPACAFSIRIQQIVQINQRRKNLYLRELNS
jgi:hypothetical protein